MSDTKKYYYMRLVENYFERTELKIIRQMPKGAEYLLILLKMSCKSFNRGGLLMITDNIPYTPESLAASIGEDLNDVRAALKILSEFSLIEMYETNEIHVKDIQNFIGHASSDADRKRRERNIKKQLKPAIEDKTRTDDGQKTGQMSASGQTSTIDIDRAYSYSKEFIDIDRDKEKKNKNSPPPFSEFDKFKKKPNAHEFEPEKTNPDVNRQRLAEIKEHWKSLTGLPQSKLLDVNNRIDSDLLETLMIFPNDDIILAINNYSKCLEKIEPKYRIKSFTNFMCPKKIETWSSDAAVEEYFPKNGSKNKMSDEEAKEAAKIIMGKK
jgi:predicted phage replisome organizer